MEIFDAFVQSKLHAPQGWRTTQSREEFEEIVEIEEDDRTAFSEQLSSVGAVARCIPEHSLTLLVTALSQRYAQYLQLFKLLQNDKGAFIRVRNQLYTLHEDIHWLILIAGYTLCDVVEGEGCLIPHSLMMYSVSEQDHVAGCSDLSEIVLGCTEPGAIDKIVALVAVVCQWCVIEKACVDGGFTEVISPQVSESAIWCLSIIAQSYVMFQELDYDQVGWITTIILISVSIFQVSLALIEVFGVGVQSGQWLISFLLEKMVFNISVWSAEEELCLTSAVLLEKMGSSKSMYE